MTKGILLDLDNTLYKYDDCHNVALQELILSVNNLFGFNEIEIKSAYKKARNKTHIDLKETASSHNRLIYIQKMLELLDVNSIKYSLQLNDLYWSIFMENMKLFDGVKKFIEKYENRICIVTDLTADIQFKKLKKLGIESKIRFMVSSEEAGKEKPHSYPFLLSLYKLKLEKEEVLMIGDNFKKDILGAYNIGIKSIWLNLKNESFNYDSDYIQEVKSFNKILNIL